MQDWYSGISSVLLNLLSSISLKQLQIKHKMKKETGGDEKHKSLPKPVKSQNLTNFQKCKR